MAEAKKKKEKAPQRTAVAGPARLTIDTAPGALSKSLTADASKPSNAVGPQQADIIANAHNQPPAPVRDTTATQGKIKIIHSMYDSLLIFSFMYYIAVIGLYANYVDYSDAEKEVLCCKFNEDFSYLAAGCTDGCVNIYKHETAELLFVLTDKEISSATAPVTGIQHRTINKNYPINNCFTCTYANGWIKNWNYNFKQCIYTIKEKRETYGLTYHPRYPKFITYGDDKKIYLYDEETKTQERILTSSNDPQKHDGPTSRVFAACFNPQNNYELVTGGWDDALHFWDLRQPHSVRLIGGVRLCGEGIDISAKGTEILTCGFQNEKALRVFDYSSGKVIGTMDQEDNISKMYCGRICTPNFAVYGGTAPNSMRAVDLNSYLGVSGIINLPSAVYGLDIGLPKKAKENQKASQARTDQSMIPEVAFVSGTKLYVVDFLH